VEKVEKEGMRLNTRFFGSIFSKMDFVNQITLDCLLNKEMYTDHVQNKKIAKVNKEERKLYKKRVFQLFKDSITGSEPEDLSMDIKYAYNNYINSCIQYFKTKDNHDTIQSEFKDFIFTQDNEVIQDISFNEINQSENNLAADKILLFSTFEKSTFAEGTGITKDSTKLRDKTKSNSKKEATTFMFSKIETKDK
jgi:hypothetical protein